MQSHTPVLLNEAVDALQVKADGIYVDATFGRGGHSGAILNALSANGRLVAFDKDSDAVLQAQHQLGADARFSIEGQSFTGMQAALEARAWCGKVDGILIDCGVSSPQLDEPSRGFSFLQSGPLDMRMDTSQGQTAAQWIAHSDEALMADVFKRFGEERFARRIARAIVQARQRQAITDTLALADIVRHAHPAWEKHKHPATRVFQAIRIAVNGELDELQDVLAQALTCLHIGGRLVVISFHSLEDRVVKQFINQQARVDAGPVDLPIATGHMQPRVRKIGALIRPSESEVKQNPRARSARMRVVEKQR